MAPVAYVDNKDHIERLVAEKNKLVVRCFAEKEKGRGETAGQQDDDVDEVTAVAEVAASFDSVLFCSVDLLSHADVTTSVLAASGGGGGGETRGRADATPLVSCWMFFNAGKLAYIASDSTPRARISRLVALLDRSPGTLDQLSHQDEVSRRQQRIRVEANRDSAAGETEEAAGAAGEDKVKEVSAGKGGAGKEPAVRIFIAGDRSQVGKTSTCLGLLGALLRQGLTESELAYIKPATQCEKPQLITEWCEMKGIACRGIGPVVFYKGFTREFLRGGAGTSEDLLQELRDAVEEISQGKKVVVVDGVGYPAVGSICGVSNSDVAAALNAPVLLVGKSGVGDAVDSYNLNACFFEARGVRVLGGVFNRISNAGYYSLDRCREAVTSYFAQANPNAMPYGFIPEITSLTIPNTETTTATVASTTTNAVSPGAVPPVTTSGGKRVGGAGVTEIKSATVSAAEGVAGLAAAAAMAKLPCLPVTAVQSEEELESFARTAGSGALVVVDFGAEWCKNCKTMLPFVHGLPERFQGGVAVATVDVDEASEVADAHGVNAIPHFLLLKSGVKVGAYTGSVEANLESAVRQQLSESEPTVLPGLSKASASYGGIGTAVAAASETFPSPPEAVDAGGDGGGGYEEVGALRAAEELIEAFSNNVDVPRLLDDIRGHARMITPSPPPVPSAAPPPTTVVATAASKSPSPRLAAGVIENESVEDAAAGAGRTLPRRTREEVEAEAAGEGASGG